jgi:hypothetical protein
MQLVHGVILKHSPFCYEVMDSLGLTEEEVKLRLGRINQCAFNSERVQPETSTMCGAFCAYFVFCRLTNYDMDFEEIFSESFSKDLQKNEDIVSHFWETGEISE